MSTVAHFELEQYERMICAGVFDGKFGKRRDYWVVNLNDQCIEVYQTPTNHRCQTATVVAGSQEVHPRKFPEAVLQPARIVGG